MKLLSIKLLGEFSATDHRGNALAVGNKRTRALIAYLALRLGGGVTVTDIAQVLFGDPEATAQVHDLITNLRYALRYIPGDVLIGEGDSLSFSDAAVSVDALEFATAAERASAHSLRQAAELYRGNLLEGYSSGISTFDDWVSARRLQYWRLGVGAFGRLLALQIKAGWWESAVETASRLLSLDPSQEIVHRTLMRLQLEQGRPDSALRRYQECADILRRDFGTEPGVETERVHEEILAALARSPAPREMFANPAGGPVLVLLVEDDLVSSALVEGFLTEAGYEVVAVNDGADALIEIGRRHFELLILDVNVPTLSGLQLFEIMIQKGIDTPAVFITGVAGPEAEARSLEMGAADFLRKPIRKEALLPRVRTILQRHRSGRASN